MSKIPARPEPSLEVGSILRGPAQDLDPYETWNRQRTSTNLKGVLTHVDPTINSAVTTYAGRGASALTKSRARAVSSEVEYGEIGNDCQPLSIGICSTPRTGLS